MPAALETPPDALREPEPPVAPCVPKEVAPFEPDVEPDAPEFEEPPLVKPAPFESDVSSPVSDSTKPPDALSWLEAFVFSSLPTKPPDALLLVAVSSSPCSALAELPALALLPKGRRATFSSL